MQKLTFAAVVAAIILVVAGVITVAQVSVHNPDAGVAATAGPARVGAPGAHAIRSDITAAGYADVGQLQYTHGEWRADAETAHGKRVTLRVNPANGKVIATRQG